MVHARVCVSLTHSMTGMRQARVRGTTHSDRAAHGVPRHVRDRWETLEVVPPEVFDPQAAHRAHEAVDPERR